MATISAQANVIRKWWWRLGVFSLHRLRGRPHSSIGSHSLACWSNQLQNSIVAADELQLSAYMHRKASSAVICPLDSRPPSHFTTPLPTATRVPDEERSIERRTRRGGRERGEREERREGLCSIGYSFRYAHYYIILYYRPSRDSNTRYSLAPA